MIPGLTPILGLKGIPRIVLSITGSVSNYNIRDAAIASGWDAASLVRIVLDIGPSAVIYSSSTGLYSIRTGAFGSSLKGLVINNQGIWCGKGGAGGNGGVGAGDPGSAGSAGGPCFLAEDACVLNNSGTIGGGGQGGSGADGYNTGSGEQPNLEQGGGGGGGAGFGSGGAVGGGNGGATTGGAAGGGGAGATAGGALGDGVAIQGISLVTLNNTGSISGAQTG